MDNRDKDTKFVAWVATGILALLGIETFFRHPTFGNGLRGFVAMVTFAEG
jgi:hypothetical protein